MAQKSFDKEKIDFELLSNNPDLLQASLGNQLSLTKIKTSNQSKLNDFLKSLDIFGFWFNIATP